MYIESDRLCSTSKSNVYVMGICICQQAAYYFAHKDLDSKVLCILLGAFLNTY